MSAKGVLSYNIKKYRNAMDLSQEDLAEKIGVSRQAVTKWENPNTDDSPLVENLEKLTEVFHISFNELMYENNADTERIRNYNIHEEIAKTLKNIERMNNPDGIMEEYAGTENWKLGQCLCRAGAEEADKRNFDNAVSFLEESLANGFLPAFDVLLDIYFEGGKLLEQEMWDSDYYDKKEMLKYQLSFARRVQNYGKIAENEISKYLL